MLLDGSGDRRSYLIDSADGSIDAIAEEQQGTATKEIARNIEPASHGTASVTRDVNQMGEAAAEAEHASTDLLAAATELGAQSDLLRGEIDLFLSEVRAA